MNPCLEKGTWGRIQSGPPITQPPAANDHSYPGGNSLKDALLRGNRSGNWAGVAGTQYDFIQVQRWPHPGQALWDLNSGQLRSSVSSHRHWPFHDRPLQSFQLTTALHGQQPRVVTPVSKGSYYLGLYWPIVGFLGSSFPGWRDAFITYSRPEELTACLKCREQG